MDISLTTFMLCLSASLIVGVLIGYSLHFGLKELKKWLKIFGLNFRYKLVDYWFVLIFTIATIFVIPHFKECIALSFTEKFNGMNLIFLFWLALLIFPMFESFEGFGISIKKRKFDKEKEAITSDFHTQVMNAQIKMHRKERRRSMNNEMITVIKDGMDLMKNSYFDDNMFMAWMDYSRKMLDLVSKNAMIKYQYTTFLMSIISSQDKATVKLRKCIDYLINIAPLI